MKINTGPLFSQNQLRLLDKAQLLADQLHNDKNSPEIAEWLCGIPHEGSEKFEAAFADVVELDNGPHDLNSRQNVVERLNAGSKFVSATTHEYEGDSENGEIRSKTIGSYEDMPYILNRRITTNEEFSTASTIQVAYDKVSLKTHRIHRSGQVYTSKQQLK